MTVIKNTSPAPAISLTNSLHRTGVQMWQRRTFLNHLTNWSLDNDASPHFHGKISVLPVDAGRGGDLELGKPVTCVLTHTSYTDARQIIVIKLFSSQELTRKFRGVEQLRRDSMEVYGHGTLQQANGIDPSDAAADRKGRYTLVVRCGSGWMSSRDYFNKIYFSRLETRPAARLLQNDSLETRSKALGSVPLDKDSVTIRPLFHPFRLLPAELQDLVLVTAAGLSRSYDLRSDDYDPSGVKIKKQRAAISLSTMLRISKRINENLLPYVYHSTDFHFGLTGFTSFLWQSGPTNRREVRRLTFHFGKLALLHCIRWMAPEPVFELFEPPVATNPRSLQYFWRCQIQDLVKEVELLTLTLNIHNIPPEDLPMIVAIMENSFGSVKRLQFVDYARDGKGAYLKKDDDRLKGLVGGQTWRDMCLGYYRRHRMHSYYFKWELLKGIQEDVQDAMNCDKEFYDEKRSFMS
ncbi:hypothetical protein CC86DRAFT_298782 [Ophiobolus disseminans]|uniref:Uncharacterized protein n=1 Tax=Ophiobolus disseminans TaxID=1469910 RepID=A0A6A6ZRN6_9PLEO|nr:hypothetical protein CC86DRAFT_298782 [Ophiobolus disseminans]